MASRSPRGSRPGRRASCSCTTSDAPSTVASSSAWRSPRSALTLARALGPLWIALIAVSLLALTPASGCARSGAARRPASRGWVVVGVCAGQGVWDLSRGSLAAQKSPPPQAHAAAEHHRALLDRPELRPVQADDRGVRLARHTGTGVDVLHLVHRHRPGRHSGGSVRATQALLGGRRGATLAVVVPIALEVPSARGRAGSSGRVVTRCRSPSVSRSSPGSRPRPASGPSATSRSGGSSSGSDPCSSSRSCSGSSQTLRRYMVGSEGGLLFFLHSAWSPPVPALALIVVFRDRARRAARLALHAPGSPGRTRAAKCATGDRQPRERQPRGPPPG